jgi:predicted nucleic acid-binding Zn ribbon protein
VSANVVALIAGTVLGVGALAFVLYPLFFAASDGMRDSAAAPPSPEASAILALREIEFDRATGKLSETDYAELRKTYAGRALKELRDAKDARAFEPLDPIEARVRAFRMTHRDCPTCGLRPEPDAIYCSTCGGFLDRACPDCGASIGEPGAVFCSSCGATLARGRQNAFA